jgi:type 1 glutamine amidotransferase
MQWRLALLTASCVGAACSCSSEEQSPSARNATTTDAAAESAAPECCPDAEADVDDVHDAGGDHNDGPVRDPPRVLLFSRTLGYRHDSIPAATAALQAVAASRAWTIRASEDAGDFSDDSLAVYDVVVFLLTTGDVLDEAQQSALVRFMQSGRGWVGVHSASDTEYDWPWYGELVGAYFSWHPPVQPGSVRVERPSHLATRSLPSIWSRTDEWYSFQVNPRSAVHVLLAIDEASYDVGSGAMGDHPIAWYHGHDGGRAFYTALGHSIEGWSEPAFVDHVSGAIEWAAGREAEGVVLVEFDEVSANGTWEPHQPSGSFPFEVTPERLVMDDVSGVNQHLTRRGLTLDPLRPYVIEGLFRLDEPPNGIDSFCFNLNLAGAAGDYSTLATWSINVDAVGGPPNGVMKHMGFAGGFREIGFEPAPWVESGIEYLLRVGVNHAADGSLKPNAVTASVFQAGVPLEHFEVDYTSFPYQPDPDEVVRFGVNTHGTDWSLRSLRIYYTD